MEIQTIFFSFCLYVRMISTGTIRSGKTLEISLRRELAYVAYIAYNSWNTYVFRYENAF